MQVLVTLGTKIMTSFDLQNNHTQVGLKTQLLVRGILITYPSVTDDEAGTVVWNWTITWNETASLPDNTKG